MYPGRFPIGNQPITAKPSRQYPPFTDTGTARHTRLRANVHPIAAKGIEASVNANGSIMPT